MAIKENIQAIKEEIGAEEQFLENLIKGERFFKRYKFTIIATVTCILVFAVGYSVNDYLKNKKLILTNLAYNNLQKNPLDKKSLEILKNGNEKLYLSFLFTQAKKNADEKELQKLLNTNLNPVLKDLAKLDIKDQNSEIYKNIQNLLKAYDLLSQNRLKDAKNIFSQIPTNSQLQEIVKKLNHYQGKAK